MIKEYKRYLIPEFQLQNSYTNHNELAFYHMLCTRLMTYWLVRIDQQTRQKLIVQKYSLLHHAARTWLIVYWLLKIHLKNETYINDKIFGVSKLLIAYIVYNDDIGYVF